MKNNFISIEGNGVQLKVYCVINKQPKPVYYIKDRSPMIDMKTTYNIVSGKYVVLVRNNTIKNIILYQLLEDKDVVKNVYNVYGRPLYLKTIEDYDLYYKGKEISYIQYIRETSSENMICKSIYRISRCIGIPINKYVISNLSLEKKKEILINLLQGKNINLGEMINE